MIGTVQAQAGLHRAFDLTAPEVAHPADYPNYKSYSDSSQALLNPSHGCCKVQSGCLELRQQVKHSQNEGNRQRAAIAILDRAGIETVAKTIGQPKQAQIWFDNLVRSGEEEKDEA
jgi:hypothetical protein